MKKQLHSVAFNKDCHDILESRERDGS